MSKTSVRFFSSSIILEILQKFLYGKDRFEFKQPSFRALNSLLMRLADPKSTSKSLENFSMAA
jgi:hypothetical protein